MGVIGQAERPGQVRPLGHDHDPALQNAAVLVGDVVTSVSELARSTDGDIVIPGSFRLVRTLLEHELVDELRVMVFPFVLGAGRRAFEVVGYLTSLRLRTTATLGSNLALLTYERA